jgi:hypothetical protein
VGAPPVFWEAGRVTVCGRCGQLYHLLAKQFDLGALLRNPHECQQALEHVLLNRVESESLDVELHAFWPDVVGTKQHPYDVGPSVEFTKAANVVPAFRVVLVDHVLVEAVMDG